MILTNWLKLVVLPAFLFLLFIPQLTYNRNDIAVHRDTIIDETAKRLAENALKGLTIAPGLEATLVATEPMLINPTNIDVDERGRIWVTEAYNYRPAIN